MGLQSPGRFGGKKNKRLTGSVRNRITKPARGCCSTPQLCLRAQTLALGSAIRKARRLRWHGRPAREEGMGHGPEAHATAGAEGSDGTVYGWGVTDVTNYSMYHMAWATTTLTSPVKHRQASSTASAQNWTRADVSLPFDPDDLGTYSVSSTHTGYCFYCSGRFGDNLYHVLLHGQPEKFLDVFGSYAAVVPLASRRSE